MRMVMPQFGARVKIRMPQLAKHREQLQSFNSEEFDITVNKTGDEFILENRLPYHDMKGHKEQFKQGLGKALPEGLPKKSSETRDSMHGIFSSVMDDGFRSDAIALQVDASFFEHPQLKELADEIVNQVYTEAGDEKPLELIDVDKVESLVNQFLAIDPPSFRFATLAKDLVSKLKADKAAYDKALQQEQGLTKGKLADMLDAFFRNPTSVIINLDEPF